VCTLSCWHAQSCYVVNKRSRLLASAVGASSIQRLSAIVADRSGCLSVRWHRQRQRLRLRRRPRQRRRRKRKEERLRCWHCSLAQLELIPSDSDVVVITCLVGSTHSPVQPRTSASSRPSLLSNPREDRIAAKHSKSNRFNRLPCQIVRGQARACS